MRLMHCHFQNHIMSNTKSLLKNFNALPAAACMTLLGLGLMATTQNSAAQGAGAGNSANTSNDTAFDDSGASFKLWDGGFAATQKKFATASPAAPNPPAAKSPAAATLAAIAGAQVLDWTFKLDNMLQRMGEIRLENLSANNGGDLHYNGNLWIRAYADRLNASGAITGSPFHEYTGGASIGADKAFIQKPTLTAIIGLMGDISKTNRDFNDGGTGSTRDAGAGLYATLLSAHGWFAGLAARIDALNTKFTASPASPALNDSRTTTTETLSLEAGRVFERSNGWWFEPSLQAAIAWSPSAATDPLFNGQPLRIQLDSSRDLQYRAMVRFGRQLGSSHWYPYGKFAIAKADTSGGTINIADTLSITPDYNGPRVELGLGAICRINEFNQLYLDYTYLKSLNYNSPWSTNLGYRLLW